MRRWLKQEEPFPEDQRPTIQAKEHYLNVRLLFIAVEGCIDQKLIGLDLAHWFHNGNAGVKFCQLIVHLICCLAQIKERSEMMSFKICHYFLFVS